MTLAVISTDTVARLPQSYESAKVALADCASIDECQSWADKAMALASYARQAQDDELMKMAVRIRDRAIRRSGELLKQIEPGQGSRDGKRGTDDHTPLRRKDAAGQAGMSKHQQIQAIRVANVPAEDFEHQVESEDPPTVTKLAEQGKKPAPRPIIDLKGRDPDEFNRALHFVGDLEGYRRDVEKVDLDAVLPLLNDSERVRTRAAIAVIDAFLDRIVTRI